MEATTLVPSLRPTSARFLNADHSKPRLQTSSGSCTKRAGEVALGTNIAEGREPEWSVRLRYTPGLVTKAEGCGPREGALVWMPESRPPHGGRAFGIRFPLSP